MASARRDLIAVSVLKIAASAAVIAVGLRAVSDDDFARVVIAQRFTSEPSLDPSGTSWLPLPFWVYGAPMIVFGHGLDVARATAFVLGVLGALVVYTAGVVAHGDRSSARLGAMLAAVLPTGLVLGVATVPEFPTAALIAFGAATLASRDDRHRWAGGAALFAATLSRYEAWPVAAAFAAFSALDAYRARRATLLGPSGLALIGPASWIAHGVFVHGDGLFFLHRVAAYKRALGDGEGAELGSLLSFARRLLFGEPELALGFAVSIVFLVRAHRDDSMRTWGRPLSSMAALVVFLFAGAVFDGTATHHAGRSLLPVWFMLALIVAHAVSLRPDTWRTRFSERLAAATAAAVVAGGIVRLAGEPEPFIDRSHEVAVGNAARKIVSPGATLLVDTPDYGYFAVIAAFGNPDQAIVLRSHDPREPRETDPYDTETSLEALLADRGASYLVAPAAARALVADADRVLAESGHLLLLRASP